MFLSVLQKPENSMAAVLPKQTCDGVVMDARKMLSMAPPREDLNDGFVQTMSSLGSSVLVEALIAVRWYSLNSATSMLTMADTY